MAEKKSINEEEITDDELEEILVSQFSKQGDKKHRGYGGYERKPLHKGPKAEKKKD
ncbi:stalled ribosome alternative rescue factor ArfA [Methanohalophilus levihalophilus]|uniref:hypothetical protein n=1 Tax=Methanohalophilus levihalophilus TaxID=1431282 RepID=UPI001AE5DCC6|nr:hypothetical protein [Methanohalophilus levihalophilus]MBP2029709.1 stalled ribosome alternative rescue factor ArfA [Methanohalophilus levihalophilus]